MMKLPAILALLALHRCAVQGEEAQSFERLNKLKVLIHRNGEPDPCGAASLASSATEKVTSKYEMETFLTNVLGGSMDDSKSCGSLDSKKTRNCLLYTSPSPRD